MPKFRIMNTAANHRMKIDGAWKSFRFGDEITLTQQAFQSGAYNNLMLQPVYATQVAQDQSPIDPDTDPKANSTITPAAPTGNGEGEGNQSAPVKEDEDDNTVSEEKVEELLDRAKEAKVDDGSFEKVRQEIVELDLFDNLPETKKGVIEALEELLKA